MNATILVAAISASAALAAAALSYLFHKRRDRETEWRKLKLEHYKEYVLALSGILDRRSTPDLQARYADAMNLMTLIAPPMVLRALYEFQDETRVSNKNKSPQRYEVVLTALLREIRRDVHPKIPADAGIDFQLILPAPCDESGTRSLPVA
jgi:hypothetical protein